MDDPVTATVQLDQTMTGSEPATTTDQLDQTMTGSEPATATAQPVEQLVNKDELPELEKKVDKSSYFPSFSLPSLPSIFNGGRKFNYSNTETKQQGGTRVVRKVNIKNGKGYKSVTKYRKGKKTSTVKKPIQFSHIESIRMGIFIPRLFADCRGSDCGKNKTHRKK